MGTKIQESDGSEHEQSRKGKRPRPVVVEVVRREGESVLVKWIERKLYHQASVLASDLHGNKIDKAVLAQAIPYGVDWAGKFSKFPKSRLLANELRRQGIWTADDFKRRITDVRAAIQRIYTNPLVNEMVKEL